MVASNGRTLTGSSSFARATERGSEFEAEVGTRLSTEEAMVRLRVKKGDTLYLTEAADGSYRLTPNNPELARQMALAEDFMHTDREVLRSLAK